MSRNKEKVYRLDEKPEGADEKKPIPAPITVNKQKKAHVELYLRATGVPIWERGGRKAFAVSKGMEFGTDSEFEQLFKAY